ncbi:MAG: hypothetical protein AAF206_30695, partial [Bacteroidota bacterium]
RKRGAKSIQLSAEVVGQELQLTVYNDGPALPMGFDLREQNGIGLHNTLNRLEQLYEGAAYFTLENDQQGVKASIRIPYQSLIT